MKKVTLIIAALIFMALGVKAQDFNENFTGIWGGTITRNSTGSETYIMFQFIYDEDEDKLRCYKLTMDDDGDLARDTRYHNQSFTYQTDNAIWSWVNSGGIWSETQSYLFTLTEGQLQIYHIRVVNNDMEGVNEDEVWGYVETGFLDK